MRTTSSSTRSPRDGNGSAFTTLQTPYTELPEVWLVPWGLSPSSKAPAALLLCEVCPRLSAFASFGWRVVVAGVCASTHCRPHGGGGEEPLLLCLGESSGSHGLQGM